MTSAFTVILVASVLLSSVTARPTVSHQQNVGEQGFTTFLPQQQGSKEEQIQADATSVMDAYDSYLKLLKPQYPAKQQGITLGLPHWQQKSAEKQGSVSWRWAQQQAPQYAKEEGITFRLPQQESAEKQWISWYLAQQQAPQDAKEEGITFTYPYNRRTKQAKGESITVDLPYNYAKQEGITFTYPQNQQSSAKEQGFTMRLPQQQGIRLPVGPFGKEQGITFSYPQTQRVYGAPYYGSSWFSQQKSSNANKQGSVTVSWRQQLNKLNAAIQGVLCSAAYDAGKLADVAAYVQMDEDALGNILKQLGKKLCDKDTNDTETE